MSIWLELAHWVSIHNWKLKYFQPRTFITYVLFPMEDFFNLCLNYGNSVGLGHWLCILCLCPRLRPFPITYTPWLSLLDRKCYSSSDYYFIWTVNGSRNIIGLVNWFTYYIWAINLVFVRVIAWFHSQNERRNVIWV